MKLILDLCLTRVPWQHQY